MQNSSHKSTRVSIVIVGETTSDPGPINIIGKTLLNLGRRLPSVVFCNEAASDISVKSLISVLKYEVVSATETVTANPELLAIRKAVDNKHSLPFFPASQIKEIKELLIQAGNHNHEVDDIAISLINHNQFEAELSILQQLQNKGIMYIGIDGEEGERNDRLYASKERAIGMEQKTVGSMVKNIFENAIPYALKKGGGLIICKVNAARSARLAANILKYSQSKSAPQDILLHLDTFVLYSNYVDLSFVDYLPTSAELLKTDPDEIKELYKLFPAQMFILLEENNQFSSNDFDNRIKKAIEAVVGLNLFPSEDANDEKSVSNDDFITPQNYLANKVIMETIEKHVSSQLSNFRTNEKTSILTLKFPNQFRIEDVQHYMSERLKIMADNSNCRLADKEIHVDIPRSSLAGITTVAPSAQKHRQKQNSYFTFQL